MASRPSGPVSWVLILVLFAAIAVGAAASILASPNSSSYTSSSGGPAPEVLIPVWVFVGAILGMLGVVIAIWILIRIDAAGGRGTSNRTFFAILFAIALIALVVIGIRVFGLLPTGTAPSLSGAGGNGTGNQTPTPPPCSGCAKNISGVGSVDVFPGVPPWLPFVILAVVAAIAVAIAVPKTRQYLSERRFEARDRVKKDDGSSAVLRDALSRASTRLDLGADPRTVILALYEETLLHLRPMVGSVDSATPEEIRTIYLEHFGVRPPAARTLTRLFEEARYSTHPMGPAESARAREAMQATIDDLSRRSFAQ